ncbi:hypothetical protein VDGL01_10986 [Verticillium dahliae]
MTIKLNEPPEDASKWVCCQNCLPGNELEKKICKQCEHNQCHECYWVDENAVWVARCGKDLDENGKEVEGWISEDDGDYR